MIQLIYKDPSNYESEYGTFTVENNLFKTLNTTFFKTNINDGASYFFICNNASEDRKTNLFFSQYTKNEPDVVELELLIIKRNDYIVNRPVANAFSQGNYIITIDIYWGVYEHNLETLEDVNLTNVVDGQVLKYDSISSKWINAADVSGPATLAALTDVTLTAPALNEVLTYNGADWVNQAVPAAPVALPDLTDVTLTAPALNEVLTYNGADWVNQASATGATSLNELTDVTLSTVSPSELLMYNNNSSSFENVPPPIKKAVYIGANAPTSTPNPGEFSIVDGGGGPNTFYINEIDKLDRNFGIQLSNWFIPHVRDMSFSSTSVNPIVVSIDTALTNAGGVWSAQTTVAPIAISAGATYTVELDARNLLYMDKSNNVSLNSGDEFGSGTDNINFSGDNASLITTGTGNTFLGSGSGVNDGTVSNNTLLGSSARSDFDNCVCIGAFATSTESNSLNLNNMTTELTATGGAAGAPPVSCEKYLKVFINNVAYKMALYNV